MARRTIEIKIRLNEEEADLLNRSVNKAGISRESYIRSLIKGMPIKEQPSMDLIDILRSLQSIGNNMNQIAVRANKIGFIDTEKYWDNVRELHEIFSRIMEVAY